MTAPTTRRHPRTQAEAFRGVEYAGSIYRYPTRPRRGLIDVAVWVCLVRWGGNRYPNTEKCRELVVVDTGIKRQPPHPEARDLRERIKTLEAAKLYASAEALRQRLRGEDPAE